MERIQMVDIIPLIDIPDPIPGRTSYNVPCPCCDTNPKKKHLNINLEKDVFRCPRCGFSGGVFDLYAYYAGINRKNAREILYARLNLDTPDRLATPEPKVKVPKRRFHECPITDVDTRHETYTALLGKLTLASDHRENLLSRGLTEEMIQALGYKTTPVMGTSLIAKQLHSEGYYLSGVPGFYHRKDGTWNLAKDHRGILIPVRDYKGRIQGLQIRRDNTQRRKFRWFSSVGKPDGTRAETWTHLAGPPQETVLITEGPLKADVIYQLTGQTVLSVPGVNSLKFLDETIRLLMEQGTKQVMTAFDMDYLSNPHVQIGYQNLTNKLNELEIPFGTYLWDPQYKGLDDYIWQFCYRQEH